MADYREMYLTLFQATEAAMETLIAAQRACETLYVESPEPEIYELPRPEEPEE